MVSAIFVRNYCIQSSSPHSSCSSPAERMSLPRRWTFHHQILPSLPDLHLSLLLASPVAAWSQIWFLVWFCFQPEKGHLGLYVAALPKIARKTARNHRAFPIHHILAPFHPDPYGAAAAIPGLLGAKAAPVPADPCSQPSSSQTNHNPLQQLQASPCSARFQVREHLPCTFLSWTFPLTSPLQVLLLHASLGIILDRMGPVISFSKDQLCADSVKFIGKNQVWYVQSARLKKNPKQSSMW